MKKAYWVIPLMAVCLVLGAVLFGDAGTTHISANDTLQYHASVCVYKNGERVSCGSNVLYNSGKDVIKTAIGNGSAIGVFSTIELCNASANATGCGEPVAAKTEAYMEITACGLGAAVGTYQNISVGNWSVFKEFTSTCDNVLINATRIGNASMAADLAGYNFTLVTLQTNDKVNVSWNIWVT